MNRQRIFEAAGRWGGMLASLVAIALWLIFLGANPYDHARTAASPVGVASLMVIVSLGGLLASLRRRVVLMYLLFAASFVPVGLYMLGTPGIFRFVGVANLIFLCAAVITHVSTRRPRAPSTVNG